MNHVTLTTFLHRVVDVSSLNIAGSNCVKVLSRIVNQRSRYRIDKHFMCVCVLCCVVFNFIYFFTCVSKYLICFFLYPPSLSWHVSTSSVYGNSIFLIRVTYIIAGGSITTPVFGKNFDVNLWYLFFLPIHLVDTYTSHVLLYAGDVCKMREKW